jgi:hypothetical protein
MVVIFRKNLLKYGRILRKRKRSTVVPGKPLQDHRQIAPLAISQHLCQIFAPVLTPALR